MKPVYTIAGNEFVRILRNPIVIAFAVLMLFIALLNAGGNSALLPRFEKYMSHDEVFFNIGLGNSLWTLSTFFSFLAMCISVIAIADEQNGSLKILVSKPLYRRDVIIGKFLGVSTILLLLILLTVSLFAALTMIVFSGPASFTEVVLRAGSFAILLFLNCSFTTGLVMLLGVFLNKTETLVISVVFVTQEYLSRNGFIATLGQLQLFDPMCLYISAFVFSSEADLYTTSIQYTTWLGHAIPYIVIMVIEIILVLLASCWLINRDDI